MYRTAQHLGDAICHGRETRDHAIAVLRDKAGNRTDLLIQAAGTSSVPTRSAASHDLPRLGERANGRRADRCGRVGRPAMGR
jgi:hypothetical protein